MADELRIQELVEEALNSERTPEEVCRDSPGLLPKVRECLAKVRELDEQFDALFCGREPERSAPPESSAEPAWPRIPGYEVKGLLGRGGMGVVYRARHLRLDRDVALKMLLAGEFASPRQLERFFQEARAIASLNHPNIVHVHDVSEREGRPYFTMELVEGGTLSRWLEGVPHPAGKAAELVGCLAGAIEVAHRSGIVHRDLKPANVLLTPEGIPKVTDFGLARHVAGGESLTTSGAILGTPSYMAPEQMRGSPVGSAADVYALGAILYEILTGRPPFRSDTALATQMQVLTKDPVRPSLLNNRVPRDLETICLRCLRKEPSRRYASAAELAADLQRFLAHEPIRARPVGRIERGLLWARRNPARAMVTSFGAVLLCFSMGRLVHNEALARDKRAEEAVWSPRVDGALEQLRSGDLPQARTLLDQVPDTLGDELRGRVVQARRELLLVEQLDEIRLRRVTITDGRFDRSKNRHKADLEYDDAFRAAGFGSVGEDLEVVAARVRGAAVRKALVGALDDWSFCAGDGPRGDWLLDLVHRSDPAPSPWRERLRDPELKLEGKTLAELAEDVRANRMTVQLLVGAAERMRERGANANVNPLLTVVQRAYPGDFWANFALGDVLWTENPKEAIRYAQAAVAIKPRSSIAHQVLGITLSKAGRQEDAIEQYRQAVLVEPEFAEAHGRLGYVLTLAGISAEAIAQDREAIRLNPDLPWVYQNLGAQLERVGCLEDQLAVCRAQVRVDPRNDVGRENLGRCLLKLGDARGALAEFQQAVELKDLPSYRYYLGSCLTSLGRLDEAEPELRSAVDHAPTNADWRGALYGVLVRTGREEEAVALFRAAIRARPADSGAWDGYLELCAYLGRQDEYRSACEDLLEHFADTDDPRACERVGRACLLLPAESTRPRAVALIDRALASSTAPAWLRPYFEVAKALAEYRSGRFESALELLRGPAGGVLTPLPELIRAMALVRTGAETEARRNLAAAEVILDWSLEAESDYGDWIAHVLRREAEALIVPELEHLLAGREEPRDEDTREVMIGACVAAHHAAAAARSYMRLSGAILTDPDRRRVAARALARAGAGLGDDPAEGPERARFRERVREWVRADLDSCRDRFETGGDGERVDAIKTMNSWLNDPAITTLREAEAMQPLPPAERDECRALRRDVEAFLRGTEGGE